MKISDWTDVRAIVLKTLGLHSTYTEHNNNHTVVPENASVYVLDT